MVDVYLPISISNSCDICNSRSIPIVEYLAVLYEESVGTEVPKVTVYLNL